MKDKQEISRQDTIPPLTRVVGTVTTSSREKLLLLSRLFTEKMRVDDPRQSQTPLEKQCGKPIIHMEVT